MAKYKLFKSLLIILPTLCFLCGNIQADEKATQTLKVAIADSRFCLQHLKWPRTHLAPKVIFNDQKKDLECKKLAQTSQFHGHYFLKSLLQHTQWKNHEKKKDIKIQFYLIDLFDLNGNQNLETYLQFLKLLSNEQIPIVIMAAGFDTNIETLPNNKNAFEILERTAHDQALDQAGKSIWILASGHTDLRITKQHKDSYAQGLWPQSSSVLLKDRVKKIITSWRPLKYSAINDTTGQGHNGTRTCNTNSIQGHLDTAMINKNPIDLAVSVDYQSALQAPKANYPTGSSYATAMVAGKFLTSLGSLFKATPLTPTTQNNAKFPAVTSTNGLKFFPNFHGAWQTFIDNTSAQHCILDQSNGQSNFYSTLK